MKRYLIGAVIVVFAVVFIHVPYSEAYLNLFTKISAGNELDAGDEPVSSRPAGSGSSTNVSLDNDLYRDMESWAAEGLIDSQILSIKPLTKNEAGRQIAAALDKCAAMESLRQRAGISGSITQNCLPRKSRRHGMAQR